MLPILRGIIPVLMNIFSQEENERESMTSSSESSTRDQQMKFYKEASDLLTILNPIHIFELRHKCTLISRIGSLNSVDKINAGLISQKSVEGDESSIASYPYCVS